MNASPPILTIGYGGRSQAELFAQLREHQIAFLVDVRSTPFSKFQPEFNRVPLGAALGAAGIRYLFMGEVIGGRPSDAACYSHGKVDYAKCRRSPIFQAGLQRLVNAHRQGLRLCLLCAEARPTQCHRSKLIGVALSHAGVPTEHLLPSGERMTQQQTIDDLTGGQVGLFADPFAP